MLRMVSSHAKKIIKQKAGSPTSIKNTIKFSFWAMLSEARQAQVHVSTAVIPKAAALARPDTFSFAFKIKLETCF